MPNSDDDTEVEAERLPGAEAVLRSAAVLLCAEDITLRSAAKTHACQLGQAVIRVTCISFIMRTP